MAMFRKGIVLAQHKQPAFSRPIVRFVNPQTDSMRMDHDPVDNPAEVGIDDIIDIARAAQIIDERDGRPLHNKLLRAKERAVAVLADAVDDEPYVSSRIAPLLQMQEDVLGGIALCKKVAGTEKALIVAYTKGASRDVKIPKEIGGIKVTKLHGGYPAPAQAGHLDVGQGRRLIVGIGALIHLNRAVATAKKQSTTFVTVAGNCVANSMNLEVSLGMTIQQVLERCGLSRQPKRVICGGSMTGISILDTENTQVTHTTRAVLAFWHNKRDTHYSCIGCGRCEQVCPMGLSPMYIHRFVENSYYANLQPFDSHLCIGCGTCSYICPSKLDVAVSASKAKEYAIGHFIKPQEGEDELED